jgi:hypothetical protein
VRIAPTEWLWNGCAGPFGHPDYRLNRLLFKQPRQRFGVNKPSKNSQCHHFNINCRDTAMCHFRAASVDSREEVFCEPRHFFECIEVGTAQKDAKYRQTVAIIFMANELPLPEADQGTLFRASRRLETRFQRVKKKALPPGGSGLTVSSCYEILVSKLFISLLTISLLTKFLVFPCLSNPSIGQSAVAWWPRLANGDASVRTRW